MTNKQVGIDFLKIIVIYGVYWTLIYLAATYNVPGSLGVIYHSPNGQVANEETFTEPLLLWAQVVMGTSLLCCLMWYVLGEWGLKPYKTQHGTWVLIWWVLLVVVLLTGILAAFMGPQATENGWVLAMFYLLGGAGFYYIATIFCSPVNTKYVVSGSRTLRR